MAGPSPILLFDTGSATLRGASAAFSTAWPPPEPPSGTHRPGPGDPRQERGWREAEELRRCACLKDPRWALYDWSCEHLFYLFPLMPGELVNQFVTLSEAMRSNHSASLSNKEAATASFEGKTTGGLMKVAADPAGVALPASALASLGSRAGVNPNLTASRRGSSGGAKSDGPTPKDHPAGPINPLGGSSEAATAEAAKADAGRPPAPVSTVHEDGEDGGEDMDISDNEDGALVTVPSIVGAVSGDVAAALERGGVATAAGGADPDGAAAVATAARRRNFGAGTFGSGRVRRLGAGSNGGPTFSSASTPPLTSAAASEDLEAAATAAVAVTPIVTPAYSNAPVGSCAALEMSAWLRLGMLLPLLPTVHADREADPQRNRKGQLIPALARMILLLPTPRLSPSAPSTLRRSRLNNRATRDAELLAAAVDSAGETLQERLLAVLATLLAGVCLKNYAV